MMKEKNINNPTTTKEIEIISKHILMYAIAEELLDRIWELEEIDSIWKQKMRNLLPKIKKGISSKLNEALQDTSSEGEELQKEIFNCTNDIKKGMIEYEKQMIKCYEQYRSKK